nr:MAG TPA: hypothetical protein [Caudoviricetes sp.]
MCIIYNVNILESNFKIMYTVLYEREVLNCAYL